MRSNGAAHPPPQPIEPPPQPVTADEIQRQQRAHLALRALDLEVENVLLQQEVQRLTARVAELQAFAEAAVAEAPGSSEAHASRNAR